MPFEVLVCKCVLLSMCTVWVAGRGAEAVERLSDDEVSVGLVQVLRHFLKDSSIPVPMSVLRLVVESQTKRVVDF